MKPPTRFAVLADEPGDHDVLYLPDVREPRECRVHPLDAALALNLQQIWVYSPDALSAFAALTEHLLSVAPEWTLTHRADDWRIAGYRRGRRVELYYPQLNTGAGDWDAWVHAPTPGVLCRALTAFRDATGTLPERSPGSTAHRMIRRLCSLPEATDRLPVQLRTEFGPLVWIRPLSERERAMRYVHSYDKRSMYLAALASIPLGTGIPEHVGPEEAETALYCQERSYGYYKLRMAGNNVEFNDLMPPCPTRDGWYPAPAARLLAQHGHPFELLEAWLWPSSSRWLEPWYKHLRVARLDLQAQTDAQTAGIAKSALKAVYTRGLGWLAATAKDWDRSNDELYRPDIYDAVIALARANLIRNLDRADLAPFAVNVDCVYVASDDPSPLSATRLRLGSTPGRYAVHDAGAPLADVAEYLERGDLAGLVRALGAVRSAV